MSDDKENATCEDAMEDSGPPQTPEPPSEDVKAMIRDAVQAIMDEREQPSPDRRRGGYRGWRGRGGYQGWRDHQPRGHYGARRGWGTYYQLRSNRGGRRGWWDRQPQEYQRGRGGQSNRGGQSSRGDPGAQRGHPPVQRGGYHGHGGQRGRRGATEPGRKGGSVTIYL